MTTPVRRTRKMTVALVTAGALTVGGAATAVTLANADPTTSPAPTTAPSGAPPGAPAGDHGRRGPGGPDGRGGLGDAEARQLATELGVSKAKVVTALQKAREANRPTAPKAGEKPDPQAHEAAVAKAVAKELGLGEAKVTAAFAKIRAAHEAEATRALTERLAAAVKAGTLTQADADSVLKAAKAGVIGYGPR